MITLCAIVAFSTTSCKEETEKTGYDYLTEAKNGWKLTSATSDPAYDLEIGAPVTNLLQGFVKSCELDDILYFNTSKALMLNPGKDKKTVVDLGEDNWDCGDATERSLGNWNLSTDEKSFTSFYLPYFDEKLTNITIIELSEKTLVVSVPFYDEVVEKSYTFTLTYTKQ